MNGIICCQEPTSEIIRVEKQFSRLRFKCRTTFFLGFKIDADVAPHYIIYMRLCTIHVEINYEIARFPRRFKSPILLSSWICLCLLRTRWLRPFFICLLLSVSGDACLRVILLIIRRICISSITYLIICGILRWVFLLILLIGSAALWFGWGQRYN